MTGAIAVDVVRSLTVAPELRADKGSDALGVLRGHFSVFNNWYHVASAWEGNFFERTAPGFVAQTIVANRESMRVQFDHGFDNQIGSKSLGAVRELREDETGAYFEVELDDTTFNRDLLPGFRRGAYGSSFRMKVLEDSWNDNPVRSEGNPEGHPERTIIRADVMEFGPVAWPANPAATAQMRSDTDVFYDKLRSQDRGAYEAACRAANFLIPDFPAANPSREREEGRGQDGEPGKAAQSNSKTFSYSRRALHRKLLARGIS
jgi:HK97 family phage prohead protease